MTQLVVAAAVETDIDGAIDSTTDLDRLGDEIATLAAQLHATTYQLLVRLHEFDERGGWGGGFRSCAHWLSWRTGIAPGAAREKVRVARTLATLPRLSRAMARGQLSYAKARALTRIATPANEADLLEIGRHGTATQVERVVRAWRRADRHEQLETEERRHDARAVSFYIDDDGSWVLRGRLAPEAGALLEQALELADEALVGHAARYRGNASWGQRRADALVHLAEQALAAAAVERGPARAERYQVVVHVDAEALAAGVAGAGQSVVAGIGISAETSRRLACDAVRRFAVRGVKGGVTSIGPRRRVIPPALRIALEHRDRTCRFPGCDCRYCDAHHIRHWADGGETKLENLVLLCRRHHRAVHEEGYRVVIAPDGSLGCFAPDGTPIPHVPPLPEIAAAATVPHVDEWTAAPRSSQRLDLDWTLRVLRRA